MYVDRIPNRNSNPTWLLRKSIWKNGKSVKVTLCNLNKVPHHFRMQMRELCRGGIVVNNLTDFFKETYKSVRSFPHGHVAAALGMLRLLKLDTIISTRAIRVRNIVLALIVSRILSPKSTLATAAALREEEATSSLGPELGIEDVRQNEIDQALDWLYKRKAAIEQALAARHLKEGSLALCAVTSTFMIGYAADLAEFGYSKDNNKGMKPIHFALLYDQEGRPIAVEVFPSNTADPATLTAQVQKLRERFNISRCTMVGDRGLLTHMRMVKELKSAGLDWITALRKGAIRRLVNQESVQMSLFDERDLAEITCDDYPDERLILYRNPIQAEHTREKREKLLQATEKRLDALVVATQRERRPVQGVETIALRAGSILGKHEMKKHFTVTITDQTFRYERNEASIAREANLDGLYVIRTSVPDSTLTAEEAVLSYKQLTVVEQAFRCLKTADFKVRPVHHYRDRRIEAHIFLCMLAYYVQWHMKEKLAPLMFAEENPAQAKAGRSSVVVPAKLSADTLETTRTKKNSDGDRITSFQSLMNHLALLGKFKCVPEDPSEKTIYEVLERLSPKQKKAFELLGVKHN